MPLLFSSFLGSGGGAPTPPTVVFLSGFEGADASTTITDESNFAHAMTANGDAQIDTAQFKFDTSSLLLDGTGDDVSSPDSDDWTLAGAGEGFTVEAFIRPRAAGAGSRVICSHFRSDTGINQRGWAFRHNSDDTISFFWYHDGTASSLHIATSVGTITDDVWTHVAAARDALGVLRLFIGGSLDGSVTDTRGIFNSSAPFLIGALNSSGLTEFFDGHIDELRLTERVGRYTANFTPPTAPFPRP